MKRCPRPGCNLAGESLGDCGRIKACARPTEVDPLKDVVIDCRLCDKTWSVPVGTLIKGKSSPIYNNCPTADCKAVLVRTEQPPKKTKAANSNTPKKKVTLPDESEDN